MSSPNGSPVGSPVHPLFLSSNSVPVEILFFGGLLFRASSSNVFSDTAGTVPATVGSTVGRINSDAPGSSIFGQQLTASERPTLQQSGYKYLQFDGTSDHLDITGLTSSAGDYTILLAVLPENTIPSAVESWMFDVQTGPLAMANLCPVDNSPQFNLRTGYFCATLGWVSRPIPTNDFQIITYRFSGTECDIRINGLSQGVTDYVPTPIGGRVRLGCNNAALNSFFKGRVVALGVVNRAFSNSEIESVEREIATETGVLAQFFGSNIQHFVGVGDSITFGFNDDVRTDDQSTDGRNNYHGYTPILNDNLSTATGGEYSIANEGYNGLDSVEMLADFPAILARHPKAQTVLVEIGVNDSSGAFGGGAGNGLNPGDAGYDGSYKDRMQQVIDLAHGVGKSIMFASIGFVIQAPGQEFRGVRIQNMNLAIGELVVSNNLKPGPDFYNHFKNNQTLLSADGLHPTGAGYNSMADLWRNSILA